MHYAIKSPADRIGVENHQPRAMATLLVAHFDADAFFAQVEQQLDPTLAGTAFAVQQHQDTIAISYAARALGIKKHTAPAEIRRRWPAVRLVHVAVVGGKTTYKWYRRASAAIYRVLRSFGRPLERRGMDEGFIDLTQAAAAVVSPAEPDAARYAWAAAEAERMRAAVRAATGYVISIGIGGNKLVAKLASRAAKPDGCRVIRSDETTAFFERLAVEDLPQCGGQIADSLKTSFGVTTCSQAQVLTLAQLTEACGGYAKKAEMVYRACRAEDPSLVVASGPPKTIQSQCSLTPLVLLQHAVDGSAVAGVAGGVDGEHDDQHVLPAGATDGGAVGGSSLLDPTPPWAIRRVKELLRLLVADVVERVEEDFNEHHRHPTALVLTAQLYSCSPKEVGTFGQVVEDPPPSSPSSSSSSTSSSSALLSTIRQLYEGGVVVWPRHAFLPRGAVPACTAETRSVPTVTWTRGAGDLVKGAGQSTSRSAPFPAGVLTALRAASRGSSSSSASASSRSDAAGDTDPAAVAAAEAALMNTAEKLYVAAARAAAEADGWHWNGVTVTTGSIPISATGGDGTATRAAAGGASGVASIRMTHRDAASLASYVPDAASASGASPPALAAGGAVVPGVGGIAALGTVDWMTHKLGAGALYATTDAAATSSSGASSAAPVSAIDRQWMNRFTLPLSVVKLALSATNFAAGPPSATLASMWKSAAAQPVASAAPPTAASAAPSSAERRVHDDDDDSVVVVAPSQPPLTVGKRPRANTAGPVGAAEPVPEAPAAKRRAGGAGLQMPAVRGARTMPELAFGVRAHPCSDGVPRIAFSDLLAADTASSGDVLSPAFASAMFEAEVRALQ